MIKCILVVFNLFVLIVANAHQRIDDHEKEMKQLDLQRQFLWAQVDELKVQMIPLEVNLI
jgi:hypothetical protein